MDPRHADYAKFLFKENRFLSDFGAGGKRIARLDSLACAGAVFLRRRYSAYPERKFLVIGSGEAEKIQNCPFRKNKIRTRAGQLSPNSPLILMLLYRMFISTPNC